MSQEVGSPQPIPVAQREALCMRAREASKSAYAKYSNFRVGAAVMAGTEGSIFVGANVENASFGATVCAERIALGAAVVAGFQDQIHAIALVGESNDPIWANTIVTPCGICLQWIAELAPSASIILCHDASIEVLSVTDLLRNAFEQKAAH